MHLKSQPTAFASKPNAKDNADIPCEANNKEESKWLHFISKVKPGIDSSMTKFREKVFQCGIPDALRWKIWQTFINPSYTFLCSNRSELPSIQSLIDLAPLDSVRKIENDVHRTLENYPDLIDKYNLKMASINSNHNSNNLENNDHVSNNDNNNDDNNNDDNNDENNNNDKNSMFHTTLKRVLIAYAGIDQELGYSQGMAFPAAMLVLTILDEASAFWCFYQLMVSPRFGMRDMYSRGFPRAQNLTEVWQIALKARFPIIYKKLNDSSVDPIVYTLGWWMSVFVHIPLPSELLFIVFDRFIFFGSAALISFGLTIFGIARNYIQKVDVDEIVSFLQMPTNYNSLGKNQNSAPFIFQTNDVMKQWGNYWITQREFKKMSKKAGIHSLT